MSQSINKPNNKILKNLAIILFVIIVSLTFIFSRRYNILNSKEDPSDKIESNNKIKEEIKEELYTKIRISAVGDIMVHETQIKSAYDKNTGKYNFKSVFEDIRPFIIKSDLAIANLETTLAGHLFPYSGYPMFNAPDSIVDALAYAGFNIIITANNHSFDTRGEGLKRTVQIVREKGLNPIGTYDARPTSRVVIKDVKGIKIAILAYTEHTNGLGSQYNIDEYHGMINIINKENIISHIQEAKELEADLIIAYMHWGFEYLKEPNDFQTSYAQLMLNEGVNIILGSHPHIIQRAEFDEVDGTKAFVVYSLGNFISNQRKETLGSGYEPTEDGVIINIDIVKNEETGETYIEGVEYIPTWVYRNKYEGQSQYTYRIIPIKENLEDSNFSEEIIQRMKNSYDETVKRLKISVLE